MSVVTGGEPPTGRGAAQAAPRPAVAPALADGVELIGEMEGSGYRTPPSLVRRGDGQVIQLTPLLFRVLSAVDGQRDPDEIAEVVSATSGRKVTAANVATLVQEQLLPLGFLRLADGTQPEVKKANPLLALRFRYAVTDPRSTRRITRPFAVLFQPLLVAVLLAAFVAVCGWVMFDKGLASATHQAFYAPGLLLLVFAVTVLSAGFHEFGHAAAARYGGATPGVMGMGLYLVWPAFYTDVTDSYRLGRGGRLRTDLGGLYFNAIVAVAIFGVWFVSHWDALLLVIVTQVLQMLRQLAPLVRFDGYHVLADLTGVPDLYHHIKPILLGLLPHHWGRPENKVLKPWVRVVVSTWVLLVVPLLLGLLALMVLAFPRLAATAWDSLGRQVDGFQSAVVEGNVTAMGAGILAMLAVALPLVGMVYIVTRLVRQVSASVWSSTEGRPARRGLAVLVALAIVVGLAWAWWPAEDRYRPVQAYERGTIADLLPTSQEAGLTEGTVARASTVWPADQPLPTAERPVLSVVLVPRDSGDASTADATEAIGDTAGAGTTDASGASGDGSVTTADPGTWVFPFDRPPAPVEGDNQALAVNTTDNSVVYDIAFALVWVEDGESSENVNSSYALASCTNCAAVSVAFQVVLVVGQSDTIVPQNLAAAVNYNCIECVTYALAQQLVLTVDGPLSDAAMTELVALWQEIAEFGRTITDVPLSEIQARLTEFESRIITIIERDQGSLLDRSNPSPSTSTSPSGSADPTATPTGSTGTSRGATGTDATGSDDSEPASGSSPAPTSGSTPSPTPTPDSEPTPSPEPTTSQPTPTPSPTTSAPSPTASP